MSGYEYAGKAVGPMPVSKRLGKSQLTHSRFSDSFLHMPRMTANDFSIRQPRIVSAPIRAIRGETPWGSEMFRIKVQV